MTRVKKCSWDKEGPEHMFVSNTPSPTKKNQSVLSRTTCVTCQREGSAAAESWLCLVLPLSHTEVCNLFPSCVIQCAAALCSPEEHKQLPGPLIHTGALNSFYALHPTHVLRREIICMYLPAARLISLALHSRCFQPYCSATV